MKTQFRVGVTETIDTLSLIEGIYIKNELVLKIVQNLIANKKYKKEEIKEIYSHPQAIAQCRSFIIENIPNAKIIEVSSTALAAKEIKNKNYAACIANSSCIEEYALTLLEDNIQDNNLNETKFWVLSKEKNNIGKKMSIIFSTKHKPGALYKILGILNENSINMTKIESRPAKTVLGEYIFLVDIDVNKNVDKMYRALKEECTYLRNLGLY